MPILPIIAALAAVSATPYSDGFSAHCTDGQTATVWLRDNDLAHPVIRQSAKPAATADRDSIRMIPGYVSPHGNTVVLSREGGRFTVVTLGPDFQFVDTDSSEMSVKVLDAAPGDLVLAVQTHEYYKSLTVYHLRYAGAVGALSIASTRYDGHGSDDTSLTAMQCKVTTQPAHASGPAH